MSVWGGDWSRAGHNLEGALTQKRKRETQFSLLFNAVKPMVRLCVKTLCKLLKEKKEGSTGLSKTKGRKRRRPVVLIISPESAPYLLRGLSKLLTFSGPQFPRQQNNDQKSNSLRLL